MATTSKIKTINQVSEPWGDRKILYHQLEMENGNAGELIKTITNLKK